MIGFLKSFFAGEKSPEEQALFAAQAQKPHDVLVLESYAMDDEEEQQAGGCGSGCGGCGCR
jgi:hypothetical protein